jgi:hypothetical protein
MSIRQTLAAALLVGVLQLAPSHAFVTPVPRGTTTTTSTPLLQRINNKHSSNACLDTAATFTRNNKHCVLCMGWGPDPIWSSAEILTNEAANKSGKSISLTVTVPPETAAAYATPGQYVQVRLNEDTKPLFLAISSPPNKENAVLEFLIKKTDDNDWMTGATAGTKVEMSQVLGGGFPMAEHLDGFKYDFPTQNVLLFGVGSGIAPIKAAIESGTCFLSLVPLYLLFVSSL